jgi:DNA-binding NtrC family response regulator
MIAPSSGCAMPVTKKNPRLIFIVNDDSFLAELLSDMIRMWYKDSVITLLTFTEAQRALDEIMITEPDLFITDDRMPKMSGEEFIYWITDSPARFPILVTSPSPDTEEWVKDFASMGMKISYLPQPFTPDQFKLQLDRLLESSDRLG